MTASNDPPSIPACLWADGKIGLDALADIVENVAHPIFVKDRQHRFVLLNRAFSEMVGFSREEMFGKIDHDFFPKAQSDYFWAKDLEMFETRARVVIDEEPITDRAGVVHVLATTKVPLFDAQGEPTHVVGIIHDITPLKAIERELREANERCRELVERRTAELRAAQDVLVRKERLAVLGQLAGGVAHQIRNPLGAIRNAAALLRGAAGNRLDPNSARALAVIEDEVGAADRIVKDLLEYARVRPPNRKATEVGYVLEQALGAQVVPDGIVVERAIPDVVPSVAIDADQVQVALYNILRNALEAMPDGGKLTAGAWQEGDRVVLAITDTGPGISDALRGRVFEPLVTTKRTGLGLGLTTAKALIESQGGSVHWENPAGGGARFLVRLPTSA